MNIIGWIAIVSAVLLTIYLFYALIRPEKF